MQLTSLLKALSAREEIRYKRFGAIAISDINIDCVTPVSKKCTKGSVFVCISGERFDGNDFIDEAYENGTRVFVTEKKTVELKSGIAIFSNNARKTMAEIAKILFGLPEKAMLLVGITGTKGKSTVTEIVAGTLRKLGIKTLSVSTYGAEFDGRLEFGNTTPDSSILYPLIKESYDMGARVAVIEISSQALKDYRVYGLKFDMVIFTSFGIDHIGKGEHATLAEYISAKRSLFTSYGASLAIVNYDDSHSSFFSFGVGEVIKCGFSRGSDLRISNIREGFFGMSFSLSGISESFSLTGKFNAGNIALAAAAVERISGKSLDEILRIISEIRLPGRFECHSIRSRFAIIDYAHNEKSLKEMILAVRALTKRKIITVFGSVGERSKNRRRELASVASALSDFSVITSDNPGYEDPYEIAKEIYSFYPKKESACIVVDRHEAILRAFQNSSPGDVILLLGKGHEEYMTENGERRKFSEREVLLKIKKFGFFGKI